MGLLLSRSNSHGENNSVQSAFYTDQNLNCQTVSVKRSLQTIVFTMRIRTWQQQSHYVLTLKKIVRSLHFIQPHCQVAHSILYPLLPIPLPPPHLPKDGWHPNPQFFVDIHWKINFQEFGFCWHFWKYVQRVLSREYWKPLFKILPSSGVGQGVDKMSKF